MATQQQIDALIDPLVAAGITGDVLAALLGRAQLSLKITEIDSKLRVLEQQRAAAMAEFDAQRNALQDARDATQAELDAQGG